MTNPPPPAPATVALGQARGSADRVVQAVTGVSTSGATPLSATWRVAGWLGCSTAAQGDASAVKPCGPSVTGAGIISRTSSVVLSDGSRTRIVSMSACRWIDRDLYVLCDVDGERVTPWTGRGAVTQVVDPEARPAAGRSTAGSERSDLGAVDGGRLPPVAGTANGATLAGGSVVTVVPDSEYPSRPWRND